MAILPSDTILYASEKFSGRVTKSLVSLDRAHTPLHGLLEIFGMLSSRALRQHYVSYKSSTADNPKAPSLYCLEGLCSGEVCRLSGK